MVELEPDDFIDRFPAELSGGQKQRVCIARALAAEPELIICDEVTSALDQLVAERVLELLQRLQDDLGVSYMFITHDFATVRAISDEIVVMFQGRIVEQGARNEVLAPPHHAYTDLLLSSVPEMEDRLAGSNARCAQGAAGERRRGLVSCFRSSFACGQARKRSLRLRLSHKSSCPDLFRASTFFVFAARTTRGWPGQARP